MLGAGRRGRRIRIEAPPVARDARLGSPSGGAWTTFWEGWAAVEDEQPMRNMETVAGGVRNAKRHTRVTILYVPGVTAQMRINFLDRDRIMQIISPPAELGHKEGLEMLVNDYAVAGNGGG